MKMLNLNIDLLIVDPPFGKNRYHRRNIYEYIIGSPNLIVDEAFNTARELDIKHVILHFNKIVNVEDYKIVDGFIFEACCRYLNANPKSYTILYETD